MIKINRETKENEIWKCAACTDTMSENEEASVVKMIVGLSQIGSPIYAYVTICPECKEELKVEDSKKQILISGGFSTKQL